MSEPSELKVLEERIARERELREAFEKRMDERDRRCEDRFQYQDEKTTLALTASKEAIGKAEGATEKRFDAVNEFRGTLSDQAATLLPRAEANSRFDNYDEKIENLDKRLQAMSESGSVRTGKDQATEAARVASLASKGALVAFVLAVLGMTVTIVLFVIKH
jgi:hypothetical protein